MHKIILFNCFIYERRINLAFYIDIPEYEKAVDDFSNMVYRIAFNNLINKSDSEDVAQEVFISLFKYRRKFNTSEDLKAWLIRVTVNKCKNINKSSRIKTNVPLENANNVIETEYHSLTEELSQLDYIDRTIIYLFYYEQYTIAEIAKILKKNKNTIGSRLRRAREKLKLIIEDELNF